MAGLWWPGNGYGVAIWCACKCDIHLATEVEVYRQTVKGAGTISAEAYASMHVLVALISPRFGCGTKPPDCMVRALAWNKQLTGKIGGRGLKISVYQSWVLVRLVKRLC